MIGFITDQATAQAVNDAVGAAMTSWGLNTYWLPGMSEIFSGPHAGSWFIPFSDDKTRTMVLRQGMTVDDFPETAQLVAQLGGLDARVEIDPADLIDPNAPTI